MKPNFALDFRNDAITLLHRTARSWQTVGQVALDADDLAAGLSYLRATALELSPQGITTKLVIPNAQILYTQVQATAQDAGRRRKQVARALEGMTPYAVADLAFDISGTGPTVDVAVIAKETLAEAEAFATEHRFNPVSFVAVPEDAAWRTEPWFGPTASAASHLTEGQRVERDQTPVEILGRPAPTPETPILFDAAADAQDSDAIRPDPSQISPAADDLHAIGAPDALAPPDEPALHGQTLAGEVAQAGVALTTDAARSADVESDDADPGADVVWPSDRPTPVADAPALAVATTAATTGLSGPAADLEPEEVLAQNFAGENGDSVSPPTARPSAPDANDAHAPEPPPLIEDPVAAPQATLAGDEAPMALDVVDDAPDDAAVPPPPAGSPSVLDPSIPDDVPPLPAASVMVAFGSRRALEAAAKDAAAKAGSGRTGATKPGASQTGLAKAPALGAISAARTGSPQAKVTTLPPRPSPPGVVRLPVRPTVVPNSQPGAATGAADQPAAKPAAKPGAAGKALRGLGALVTSPGIAGAKERRPVVQIVTPPTGPTSAASAAAATLTKAGAKPYSGGLGNRSLERAKPRYLGLILTGILLVFLVLVAAWSTLFLESRNTTSPDPNAVVDAGNATALPASEASAGPATADPEMLADLEGPAAADATTAVPPTTQPDVVADAVAEAVADAVADPGAPPAAMELAPTELATPQPAPAEPAPVTALDTEAAEAEPLISAPQDEFLLATMDEPPAMPDASSLPQPVARNDVPPAAAVPPPPFGTVYQFDAEGLIVPTAEGILTPEGVLLFAGRPALEPPPRPAALAAAAAPAADAAAIGAAVESAIDGAAPAASSPETPAETAPAAGAIPPAGTDPATTAAAGPVFADPALADSRPRPRPASLVPPTQNADDDASLAPQADSRFASLKPRAKPAALQGAAASANPIAALGAQGASLTAQADAVAASATAARNALTLAVSRKPAPRPQDMSRAVEEAVAVASRQPDPTTRPAVEEPLARVEPEADDEPEVAKAMPRLPTSTSVAKQATFVNAINLSRANLIGIYGSPSARYALIRQANGRYKKVSVGDSFDGGRVAAITTSEVRYQKSGKMVTLALPKG